MPGRFLNRVRFVLLLLSLTTVFLLTSCTLFGGETDEQPAEQVSTETATTAEQIEPAEPTRRPTRTADAGDVGQERPEEQEERQEQEEQTEPPVQPLPPGPGGNLIMTLGPQDPPSLDPALIGDVTSAFVARQLFSGLVRLDMNLEVQPDLAESWEVSEDGRTYTFFLRSNARFADGTPITSEDVRYSLERASTPELARFLPAQTYLTDIVGVREKLAGSAEEISGLRIIDDQTIELTIDRPKSYFLSKLTHPTSYIVDERAVQQGGSTWTQAPNGSGPFEMERWQSNQVMVLRRNVNFYRDLARLDRVTFLIGAAASNPLILYEQGEIDVTDVPSFALERVQDANNPLSEELVSVPQLSLSYIGMNVDIPPFDDRNVRQAFALMLDRQRIAEVTLHESSQPAYGILPPGMPGYNSQLPQVNANPERVRALLAESSYGSAEALPPIAAYGGGWTTLLREVAEEEYGIEIEVRTYENYGDYLDALKENQFPLYSTGWVADYPDPENFLDLLFRGGSSENHMNYANPEVDALLDEAASTDDEQERWALYQQAEQIILDDAPVIPIIYDVNHMLIKPYVKGLDVSPMGILDLATVELIRE